MKKQLYALIFIITGPWINVCYSNSSMEKDILSELDKTADISSTLEQTTNPLNFVSPDFLQYSPNLNIDTDGEIYELKPMVVRPFETLEKRVHQKLRKDRINFLTAKGMKEEYLKGLPWWDVNFLNKFTLPFIGMRPEQRAYLRAQAIRTRKHFDTYTRILEIKKDFHPEEYKEMITVYHKNYLLQ